MKAFEKAVPTHYRSLIFDVLHNCIAERNKILGKGYKDYLFPQDIPNYFEDAFMFRSLSRGNNFYGIEVSLNSFSGHRKRLKAAIEHGLYLGEYVNKYEAGQSGLPGIITFGEKRSEVILSSFPETAVLQIGPYINYAEPLLSANQIAEIKKRNGKTLLVFPAHSTENSTVKYEVNAFESSVAELTQRLNIETVFYCLYFNDFNNGLADLYRSMGKNIVCAGHRSDPKFLQRLKTYILLSDFSASNAVGTHVGYCEYLGSPHFLFKLPVSWTDDSDALKNCDWERMTEDQDRQVIFQALQLPIGSDARYKALDYYWGFSKVRSKESLQAAFVLLDKAYRGSVSLNDPSIKHSAIFQPGESN